MGSDATVSKVATWPQAPFMKVLIVGATGFVGRNLAAHLSAEGHEVHGWGRTWPAPGPGALDRTVDLLASEPLPAPPAGLNAVLVLAAESRPALVAQGSGAANNLRMVQRLLGHLAAHSPGSRVLVTSSGHVYGPGTAPRRESDPTTNQHPYALSKLQIEACALEHARELEIVLLRPFNQIGPGMAPGLLIPDLLERLRTSDGPLAMRGQDAARDFLDIRDACRAYSVLLSADLTSGSLFNLCTGRATRVSELIHALLGVLGHQREVTFAQPGFSTLVGDPSAITTATGWRPNLGLEATASFLAEWIPDSATG